MSMHNVLNSKHSEEENTQVETESINLWLWLKGGVSLADKLKEIDPDRYEKESGIQCN